MYMYIVYTISAFQDIEGFKTEVKINPLIQVLCYIIKMCGIYIVWGSEASGYCTAFPTFSHFVITNIRSCEVCNDLQCIRCVFHFVLEFGELQIALLCITVQEYLAEMAWRILSIIFVQVTLIVPVYNWILKCQSVFYCYTFMIAHCSKVMVWKRQNANWHLLIGTAFTHLSITDVRMSKYVYTWGQKPGT